MDTTDVFIELHVPDFKKVIDFYTKLGFKIVWRSEDYLVIKKGKSILNFYGNSNKIFRQSYFKKFPKNTKRGYATEIVIPIDNIKEFYSKIIKHAKIVEPLKLKK